jgi:hypothetical protein
MDLKHSLHQQNVGLLPTDSQPDPNSTVPLVACPDIGSKFAAIFDFELDDD